MQRGDLEQALDRAKSRQAAAKRRASRFQTDQKRYTTIWHAVRRKLELSVIEYVVADVIHGLSGSRGPVPGWCFASRATLGELVGLTRQGVDKVIDRLAEKGILEQDGETGYTPSSCKNARYRAPIPSSCRRVTLFTRGNSVTGSGRLWTSNFITRAVT
jgi:biotin operon repressor